MSANKKPWLLSGFWSQFLKRRPKLRPKTVQHTSPVHKWRKLRGERNDAKGMSRVGCKSIPILTALKPSQILSAELSKGGSSKGPGVFKLAALRANALRSALERDIQANLRHLHEMTDARSALERLMDRGAEPITIVKYLIAIRKNVGMRPRDIAAVPGLPLNEIRKIPRHCRRLAHQIEAINSHLYSVFGRIRDKALIDALRRCEVRIAERLVARAKKKGRVTTSDTEWTVRLVGYIRNRTGKPRYKQLSQLIRAFALINRDVSKCSASSLKTLWTDHPEYWEHVSLSSTFH